MAYTYLLEMFAFVFWILRVIIALLAHLDANFLITPMNIQIEIILAFVTIICLAFIVKRKMIGALVYLISHVGYFGTDVINRLQNLNGINDYFAIMLSILGIIIPLLIFLDIGLTKRGRTTGETKKTDWFYKNEQFDREYDERADRNQYKF